MGQDTVARRVTVAVVDDHQVVLDGVRLWIDSDPLHRVDVVAEGPEIEAVLAGPGRDADVLVLDLGIFGTSVVDRIAELASRHKVVVFSAETHDDTVRAVLEAGGSGYVTKHEGRDHLLHAVSRPPPTCRTSRRRRRERC